MRQLRLAFAHSTLVPGGRPCRGVPLEVMLRLANTLGVDPWICIPHKADDRFVTTYAQASRWAVHGRPAAAPLQLVSQPPARWMPGALCCPPDFLSDRCTICTMCMPCPARLLSNPLQIVKSLLAPGLRVHVEYSNEVTSGAVCGLYRACSA